MRRHCSLITGSALAAALRLGGCDNTGNYFPLELGSSATYRVRGFRKDTTIVRVKRVISVAGVRGFELQGPNGVSQLAWRGGQLVANQLAGARFQPALPLLSPNNLSDPITWEGTLTFLESNERANATLKQVAATEMFSGRKVRVIKATLVLDTPKRQIELESEYAAGIGLIKQQQRTNGEFNLELTRL